MQVQVREIQYESEDYKKALALRSKILREPLGMTLEAHELIGEEKAIHVGAFIGNNIIGYLHLSPQNSDVLRMRQVAVDDNFQGRGIGKKIVAFAENLAHLQGYKEIILNARESAISFYLSMGYERFDEVFVQIGLLHQKMRKTI